MRQQHIYKLGEDAIGDTVSVQVSDVDRASGDLPNVLCYILNINKERALYQLATKHGIVEGWLNRDQFSLCKQKIVKFDTLKLDKEFSLETIYGRHSNGGTVFKNVTALLIA